MIHSLYMLNSRLEYQKHVVELVTGHCKVEYVLQSRLYSKCAGGKLLHLSTMRSPKLELRMLHHGGLLSVTFRSQDAPPLHAAAVRSKSLF